MSQKIESFIRCLNNPVFHHCVGLDQGGDLLLWYLKYPVLYHCVGRDQGGELQRVP
jgi:hypothetical protein